MMDHVHVLNHPLIQHKLSILRSKNTSVKEFRELVSEISALMCYEATRNLPMEAAEVETPIGMAKVQVLAGKKLAIVPVLRAGLGMVDAMIDLIPSAKIGHIGLFRAPGVHRGPHAGHRRQRCSGHYLCQGIWLQVHHPHEYHRGSRGH